MKNSIIIALALMLGIAYLIANKVDFGKKSTALSSDVAEVGKESVDNVVVENEILSKLMVEQSSGAAETIVTEPEITASETYINTPGNEGSVVDENHHGFTSADDYITDQFAKVQAGDNQYSKAIEQIKKRFPELEPQISNYQSQVMEQRLRANAYIDKLQRYNEQIKANGSAPEDFGRELREERDQLMALATELGKEGLKVNAAIRQQATEIFGDQ